MDKIAVLIPCYNEAQTIAKVVADWKQALPEATIYVYDNNSVDGTGIIAEQAGAVVRREYKQGKGNVIRRMFREIDAQCYIMVDGDDTYPADKAQEMVELVLKHKTDMVVGDRLSSTYFEENKRPFHNFGNNLVRSSINFLFHSDVKDIMTGCRAFSYSFVKSFPVLSNGFEIETEMTVFAVDHNAYIETVVIPYKDRPQGSVSKLNTVTDGIKVLRTIGMLFRDYKPLAFFSCISGVLLLLAMAFFLPILIEYIQTGLVPRFPTLIVCGFAVLAAILSFFSGLILEIIRRKNKQDYEMRLLSVQQDWNRWEGGSV